MLSLIWQWLLVFSLYLRSPFCSGSFILWIYLILISLCKSLTWFKKIERIYLFCFQIANSGKFPKMIPRIQLFFLHFVITLSVKIRAQLFFTQHLPIESFPFISNLQQRDSTAFAFVAQFQKAFLCVLRWRKWEIWVNRFKWRYLPFLEENERCQHGVRLYKSPCFVLFMVWPEICLSPEVLVYVRFWSADIAVDTVTDALWYRIVGTHYSAVV